MHRSLTCFLQLSLRIFEWGSCTTDSKLHLVWTHLNQETKNSHTCTNKNWSQTLHIPNCPLSIIMTSHHTYVTALSWSQLDWHRGCLGRTGRSCRSSCCLDVAASDTTSQPSRGRLHFIILNLLNLSIYYWTQIPQNKSRFRALLTDNQ